MQESDDAVNVLGAPAHCSYHSNTSVQAGGACVRRGLCADQAHAIHVVGSCDVGQEWGARGACSRVQGGTSVRSAYLQCLSTAYPLLVALPEHASVAIRPRQGCLPPRAGVQRWQADASQERTRAQKVNAAGPALDMQTSKRSESRKRPGGADELRCPATKGHTKPLCCPARAALRPTHESAVWPEKVNTSGPKSVHRIPVSILRTSGYLDQNCTTTPRAGSFLADA